MRPPALRALLARPLRQLHAARVAAAAAAALDPPAVPKPPRVQRFWNAVTLTEAAGGAAYHVLLDGRPVRTPQRAVLEVPARHTHLAYLVAAEWESQDKLLRPYSLPLTSLLVRAIDDLADPAVRTDATNKLMRFLDTDSVCFHEDSPDTLVALQCTHWDPILAWARKRFGVELRTTTASLLGTAQPPETAARLRAHVDTYSPLLMSCFERAAVASKSFLIALALVERHISARHAADAARVEVMAQTAAWGEVEDAHDVDREDMQRQMGAIAVATAATA